MSIADAGPVQTAIASTGLSKRFGSHLAVDGLDLRVPAGSVFGFLGPNGSGKTTTIRMLLGLVVPSAGTCRLLGEPYAEADTGVLSRVGALVEGPAFHPYLSGLANLARLDAADRSTSPRTARARIRAALERVGLAAAGQKRYRTYSLGMRQRLGIAAALLRPRELLILDEPTNGLDPQGTREVRSLIGELAGEGVTVFLSSHLLSEVAQVCTDVAVMSAGRLVWQGSLPELGAGQQVRARVVTADSEAAAQVLRDQGLGEVRAEATGASGALGAVPAERVVRALVTAGVGVREFRIARPDLEEAFVGLTGEGFDVSG